MVNVNDVYRTVQAILNKEQRGYVGPTEFNLFAEQAQLEIFEGYFFDKSHFLTSRKGKDGMLLENLDEKINIFMVTSSDLTMTNNRFDLPSDHYRMRDLYYTANSVTRIVTPIMHEGASYVMRSRKTRPTTTFPKFERYGNQLEVFPSTITTGITLDYIKVPASPVWGYTSLGSNRTPIYNSSTSTNFEVHPSEQYKLVYMILKLAGVQVKEADIVSFAAQEEGLDNQNFKS